MKGETSGNCMTVGAEPGVSGRHGWQSQMIEQERKGRHVEGTKPKVYRTERHPAWKQFSRS